MTQNDYKQNNYNIHFYDILSYMLCHFLKFNTNCVVYFCTVKVFKIIINKLCLSISITQILYSYNVLIYNKFDINITHKRLKSQHATQTMSSYY